MASSNTLGNFSRRRIEALKFLSCISLDGNQCNQEQHDKKSFKSDVANGCSKRLANLIEDDVIEDEICDIKHVIHRYDGMHSVKSNEPDDYDSRFVDLDSNNVNNLTIDEPLGVKNIVTHSTRSKKRTSKSNGEYEIKAVSTSLRRKKIHHSLTCSDSERPYGSSNESLCPVTTSRIKTKGIPCKAITELNGEINIKFIKSIKDHKFYGERIFMVTKRRLPFLVCSFIPYKSDERNRVDFHKEVLRKRHTSRSRPLSTSGEPCNSFELFGIIKSEDGQEVSYGKLLVPTRSFKEYMDKKHGSDVSTDVSNPTLGQNRNLLARCYSYEQGTQRGVAHLPTSPPITNSKENIFMSTMLLYNPTLLDDPELIAGKHRTLLTFSSYVTSVIDYIRPCDLKKEINDKFKEKFPHIKLTLSKLRSLKKDMCKIAKTESGTEFLTIAQAYVYFEKLILQGLINKQNRKLCAAASLLLSAKLNDFKGDTLKLLIERIENIFRINRRELVESEFAVLVALEFGLHVPASEVLPHYHRLLYES